MSGLFNLPIVASFSLSLGIQSEHYVIWITVLGCINKVEKVPSLIQRKRERYLFWIFSISHLTTFTRNKSNLDHFVKLYFLLVNFIWIASYFFTIYFTIDFEWPQIYGHLLVIPVLLFLQSYKSVPFPQPQHTFFNLYASRANSAQW